MQGIETAGGVLCLAAALSSSKKVKEKVYHILFHIVETLLPYISFHCLYYYPFPSLQLILLSTIPFFLLLRNLRQFFSLITLCKVFIACMSGERRLHSHSFIRYGGMKRSFVLSIPLLFLTVFSLAFHANCSSDLSNCNASLPLSASLHKAFFFLSPLLCPVS